MLIACERLCSIYNAGCAPVLLSEERELVVVVVGGGEQSVCVYVFDGLRLFSPTTRPSHACSLI